MSSSTSTSEAQHERTKRQEASGAEPTSAQPPQVPTGMGKPADEEGDEVVNPGDPGPPILRRDGAEQDGARPPRT